MGSSLTLAVIPAVPPRRGTRCSKTNTPTARSARLIPCVALAAMAGACRDRAGPATKPTPPPDSATAKAFYADRFGRRPRVPAMTELGRQLFFDPQLSASGKMSCATCHDPRFAYGPPNDLSTQLGGRDLKSAGVRATPSLR